METKCSICRGFGAIKLYQCKRCDTVECSDCGEINKTQLCSKCKWKDFVRGTTNSPQEIERLNKWKEKNLFHYQISSTETRKRELNQRFPLMFRYDVNIATQFLVVGTLLLSPSYLLPLIFETLPSASNYEWVLLIVWLVLIIIIPIGLIDILISRNEFCHNCKKWRECNCKNTFICTRKRDCPLADKPILKRDIPDENKCPVCKYSLQKKYLTWWEKRRVLP